MNVNKSQFKTLLKEIEKDPEFGEHVKLPTVWYHDSLSKKWYRFLGLFTTVFWGWLYINSHINSQLRIIPRKRTIPGFESAPISKALGWRKPNIHWWLVNQTYHKFIDKGLDKLRRKLSSRNAKYSHLIQDTWLSDKIKKLRDFLYWRFYSHWGNCQRCGYHWTDSEEEFYTEMVDEWSGPGEYGTHYEWQYYITCPRCNWKHLELDGSP